MSGLGLILIGCIFIAYFTYRRVKKMPLYTIDTAMKRQDYNQVLETLDSITAKRFMDEYERDYLRLKVIFLSKTKNDFLDQLNCMFKKQYKEAEKVDFLQNWYLRFLLHGSKEFADLFLPEIEKECDEVSKEYCLLAHKVLLEKDVSCLDVLYQKLVNCHIGGFPMGMYHFLIGFIHEQENKQKAVSDYDNALLSFELSNIHPFDKYARDYIKQYGDDTNIFYPQKQKEVIINYEDMVIRPKKK